MVQAFVFGKSAFSRKLSEKYFVLKSKLSNDKTNTKTNWGDRVSWKTSQQILQPTTLPLF